MMLYAVCLDPLLQHLTQVLKGLRISKNETKTVAVAYADDLKIFVTDPTDIPLITSALQNYARASGAQINTRKSKALAIGPWDTTSKIMEINYVSEMKILGLVFTATTAESSVKTWTEVTNRVRAIAREAYPREMCTAQRVQYAHTYVLSTIWHTAQILPSTANAIRQITTAVTWFVWQGRIFKFPTTTLYKTPAEGGLGLIDINTKCTVLLITRMRIQSEQNGSLTADWLTRWMLTGSPANPPNLNGIPARLRYIRTYALERAYIPPTMKSQKSRNRKREVYNTLRRIATAGVAPPVVRIMRIHPTTQGETVWRNINNTWLEERVKSKWYIVAHDLLPTNERLYKIRLTATEACKLCGKTDTLKHRTTGCGDKAKIWQWTRNRIAWIIRTDPKWIVEDWLSKPDFTFWPPQRHRAVAWMLANMVYFTTHTHKEVTLQEYLDYLQRTIWKAYREERRMRQISNYLDVL
jgi:hypothetical protein